MTTSGAPPLLELRAAVGRRGAFRLGPLDLALAAGEAVAVVGPNGAGKSTALSLAVGDLVLEAGGAWLAGTPVEALGRPAIARRVAVLRQQPRVAFELSVLELVLHGRWAHLRGLRLPGPADIAAARGALERVELGDLEDRSVASLSGGERQRAFLAKALAQDSPALVLDEPTSGLDLRHRAALLGVLADVRGRGDRGILLVTHDLDLAAAACQRAVLLAGGRAVASGPVDDVFTEASLEAAFGHAVLVDRHPETGRPRVTPSLRPPRVATIEAPEGD